MARLRKSSEYILSVVERFARDKIDEPVRIFGSRDKRRIMSSLERLRLHLLAMRYITEKQAESDKTALAGVLHDLKTPMALISGYAESLQDGIGDKDYLSLIIDKISSLQSIIGSVSVASGKETADMFGVKEFANARLYFYVLFKGYADIAESRHINFQLGKFPRLAGFYSRHSDTVGVYINKSQMERVAQNILNNAVRYTPKGGRIKVTFHKGKQYYCISISDNGSGISPYKLPFIFDRYYRAHNDSGGTGLGLYICKEIVEKHGGTITARSKQGKGTKFIIRLPIVPAPPIGRDSKKSR
ncbi:MAG: HAMP domain-containing histidine kinase [Clostridia bacterium]|nr:HAMP domain-containing histidine kinase [Clostridia bacterium]